MKIQLKNFIKYYLNQLQYKRLMKLAKLYVLIMKLANLVINALKLFMIS